MQRGSPRRGPGDCTQSSHASHASHATRHGLDDVRGSARGVVNANEESVGTCERDRNTHVDGRTALGPRELDGLDDLGHAEIDDVQARRACRGDDSGRADREGGGHRAVQVHVVVLARTGFGWTAFESYPKRLLEMQSCTGSGQPTSPTRRAQRRPGAGGSGCCPSRERSSDRVRASLGSGVADHRSDRVPSTRSRRGRRITHPERGATAAVGSTRSGPPPPPLTLRVARARRMPRLIGTPDRIGLGTVRHADRDRVLDEDSLSEPRAIALFRR